MSQAKHGKVYDVIRREWVAATPEEIVRQNLLRHMIDDLGFPPGLIAVEKAIREMPHLQLSGSPLPDRRVDIICFGKGIHHACDLYPLLVVECKSMKITEKVLHQVQGYNHYLQSYFIAVANDKEVNTGWLDAATGAYRFVAGLPSYTDLLRSINPARS